MPRSKRRPGVVKGKTRRQMVHAAQNRAKRDRARRLADERQRQQEQRIAEQAATFSKYANFTGDR